MGFGLFFKLIFFPVLAILELISVICQSHISIFLNLSFSSNIYILLHYSFKLAKKYMFLLTI